MGYGWGNVGPDSQELSNTVGIEIGNTIIFVDDGNSLSSIYWTKQQVQNHIERIFVVSHKYQLLLHPEKFWPLISTYVGVNSVDSGN